MQLDFSVFPFPSKAIAVIAEHLALLTTMIMLHDLVYHVFQLYVFFYPKKKNYNATQGYIKQTKKTTQKPEWRIIFHP